MDDVPIEEETEHEEKVEQEERVELDESQYLATQVEKISGKVTDEVDNFHI